MKLILPDHQGRLTNYTLVGQPSGAEVTAKPVSRTVFAAAHVVVDPMALDDPCSSASIDWDATVAFRVYLHGLGLGIAEAMDTAQRGMGLDWPQALELITHTRQALPDALVFNGAGTEQLAPQNAPTLEEITAAYHDQTEAIQRVGGRLIIMASRALAAIGRHPDDYRQVYRRVLAECDEPVILHWLGDMFDPALRGYWGSEDLSVAMSTCLDVIAENVEKIDGIKISLLDKSREIEMRRRLPASVRMYTGDDFNYPELIAGDEFGHSDALLGIFDPLAPLAAQAIARLDQRDVAGFHTLLDPTVPLARHLFQAPTRYYKTGVVFLAWLNGHQSHFIMLGGAQSHRSLPHFAEVFRLADQCGALRDPELACARMRQLLNLYGVSSGA